MVKTVRFAREAKYYADQLAGAQMDRLNEEGQELKREAEELLRSSERLRPYSCSVAINVTIGSVVTNAYHYCRTYTAQELKERIKHMEPRELPEGTEVGNLLLKVAMPDEVEKGIYALGAELKPEGMPRGYSFAYLLKLLLRIMYEDTIEQQEGTT